MRRGRVANEPATGPTVEQWLEPGLFRHLAIQGWASLAARANRTTELRRADLQPRQAQVATTVVFDTVTEPPVSVNVELNSQFVQRINL